VGTLLTRAPFNVTRKSTGTKVLYCWRNQSYWETQTCYAWASHRETAIRPLGALNARVPVAILGAAGEDETSDDTDFSDLLGAVNG